MRVMLILTLAASVFLSLFALFESWLGKPYGLYVSTILFLVIAGFCVPFFLIYTPKFTGVVLINRITGKLRSQGKGIRTKLPWESVEDPEEDYISLELFTSGTITETYPSKDGPLMLTKWFYQYRADKNNLVTYRGIKEEVIRDGVKGTFSGLLSQQIATRTGQEAREEIKSIQDGVEHEFEEPDSTTAQTAMESLSAKYGITDVDLILEDVEYDPQTQKALAAKRVAVIVRETAHTLQEYRPLDEESAEFKIRLREARAANPSLKPSQAKMEVHREHMARFNARKPVTNDDALANAMVINGQATKTINTHDIRGLGALNRLAERWLGRSRKKKGGS